MYMETAATDHATHRTPALGPALTRVGLVMVFAWIGCMKFTAYEAAAIEGLVLSSPLTAWAHALFGQRLVASLIGVTEIAAALLLLAGFWKARLGALGAALVAATLFITASFLLTAPVVETSIGFPALNVLPGQFLLKDIALFGAAVWLAMHDLQSAK